VSAILTAAPYLLLANSRPARAGHVDPSTLSLRQLAAIRGAMWTVRGPWRFGPRAYQPDPSQPNYHIEPDNITALEYIYSYGDPYHNTAPGGAFNLNAEQQSMLATYCGDHYTHACFGPVTAQSYHQQYPDYFFTTPEQFEAWLDWLQMFWDHGLAPICFLHPDGWNLQQTKDLYEPLIRNNPRAQRLMRIIVPAGWEPARYEWSSQTWASFMQWGHDILPNALILLHSVPDTDAPGGTDENGDDNGAPGGNAGVWGRVAPYIHGWLVQTSSFDNPDEHGDPNHPEKTNFENWKDLFSRDCSYGYWNRFHNGYAGWPTTSLWGDEAIYIYAGEFCSYWNYWDNRPYAEGVGWGDSAIAVGADGSLDSCSVEVPLGLNGRPTT